MQEPVLGDIRAAREAIRGIATRTPLKPSPFLSSVAGVEVLLKLENEQPSGAFKLRGAANAVAGLPSGVSGITCCSSGNHGRAVAWAARRCGIRAVVFMSSLAPQAKIDRIEQLDAEVRIVGTSSAEAQAACSRASDAEGLHEIHPFDDPLVIAGQGTVGLEILEQRPDAATLVIPLSGGGLAGGAALAAKAVQPAIQVIGVSMENGAAMHASISAGHVVAVNEVPSLADALTGEIGDSNRFSFGLCRRLLDDVLLVSESDIYNAMQALSFEDGIACEGGAAVGAAVLLSGRAAGARGPMVLVVTGAHPDPVEHARILRGAEVRIGSEVLPGRPYRKEP